MFSAVLKDFVVCMTADGFLALIFSWRFSFTLWLNLRFEKTTKISHASPSGRAREEIVGKWLMCIASNFLKLLSWLLSYKLFPYIGKQPITIARGEQAKKTFVFFK